MDGLVTDRYGSHATPFALQATNMTAIVSDESQSIAAAIYQDVIADEVKVSALIPSRPTTAHYRTR